MVLGINFCKAYLSLFVNTKSIVMSVVSFHERTCSNTSRSFSLSLIAGKRDHIISSLNASPSRLDFAEFYASATFSRVSNMFDM